MKWIIAHWGENKSHIFDPLASVLEQWGHQCTWHQRDDMNARPALLAAIAGGDYDALLTWQRFYPMQRDILDALASSKLQTVYMDFGFIPHYDSVVFDSHGDNATSRLRTLWRNEGVLEQNESAVEALELEYARKRLASPPGVSELENLKYPYVFVPLQRPADSVVRFDSAVHDFGQLARRLLMLAAHRFFVVIKTHPLDAALDLGIPDRIAGRHLVLRRSFGTTNEELCDFLLSHAALVVGINSNMLFRAMLFDKPVLACGKGWFTGSEALREVDGVAGLTSLETDPINATARRRYLGACLARQLRFSELFNPEAVRRVFVASGFEFTETGAVPRNRGADQLAIEAGSERLRARTP